MNKVEQPEIAFVGKARKGFKSVTIKPKRYVFVRKSDIDFFVENCDHEKCGNLTRTKAFREELFKAIKLVYLKHGVTVNPWVDAPWGTM